MIRLNINPELTLKTIIESDRNFYVAASVMIYKAMKSGGAVELYHVPSDAGWSMIHATVNGVTKQLTKKQIRTNDIKYYFGGDQ